MSDLIHKIVGKIIEVGQSDTTKFRLGEIIRYSPSEILEILKQHESEIFGEESSTQTNTSNTLGALDCISRQAAIDAVCMEWCNVKHQNCEHPFDIEKDDYYWCAGCETALQSLPNLPSAQPEPISKAYAKAVFAWLLDYQIKAAEMEGRYIPYEVLSWVANDWRKENE